MQNLEYVLLLQTDLPSNCGHRHLLHRGIRKNKVKLLVAILATSCDMGVDFSSIEYNGYLTQLHRHQTLQSQRVLQRIP